MLEITGELFSPSTYNPQIGKPDAIGITTNGFVKNSGEAVMGRGCAKQASNIDTELPKILGKALIKKGNFPHILRNREGRSTLFSFPVKPQVLFIQTHKDLEKIVPHMKPKFKIGDRVPGWAAVSDIDIIKTSCSLLLKLSDENNWQKIILPRMGCGAGCLKWEEVKLEVEKILDNRFHVITFGKKNAK